MMLKIRAGEPILNYDGTEVLARFTFSRTYPGGRMVEFFVHSRVDTGDTYRDTLRFHHEGRPAAAIWRVDPGVTREDLKVARDICMLVVEE